MQLPDKNVIIDALSTRLFPALHWEDAVLYTGSLVEIGPTLIKAYLPHAKQGDLCLVNHHIKAEVIAIADDHLVLSPFTSTQGLTIGQSVTPLSQGYPIALGEDLLGRVLDGLGNPMTGPPIVASELRSIENTAPDPLTRALIKEPMPLGVKSIDAVLTCGVGQRVGIFAAAGAGKSTLLGMITRNCQADIVVLALVGERGREVREFLEYNISDSVRSRTIVVVATSDKPALERCKAIFTATTIAEYFRDQGLQVLLMVDSLTRYARAVREIGLAAGETPLSGGFPPSFFSALPRLLERTGAGEKGTITAIYTVLVEGDDMNEPVADEVRSLLDGHIILSRKLAGSGHYPAIDIPASVSRVMSHIVSKQHIALANRLRHLLSLYDEVQLLLRVGEYQAGNDPQTDEAIHYHAAINQFLTQGLHEHMDFEATLNNMANAIGH